VSGLTLRPPFEATTSPVLKPSPAVINTLRTGFHIPWWLIVLLIVGVIVGVIVAIQRRTTREL
jgi:hypothetical protein